MAKFWVGLSVVIMLLKLTPTAGWAIERVPEAGAAAELVNKYEILELNWREWERKLSREVKLSWIISMKRVTVWSKIKS